MADQRNHQSWLRDLRRCILLLESGADARILNRHGERALACTFGDPKALEGVMRVARKRKLPVRGESTRAVEAVCILLLESGADARILNRHGERALACTFGAPKALEGVMRVARKRKLPVRGESTRACSYYSS